MNEEQQAFKQWLDRLPDEDPWKEATPLERSQIIADGYVNHYLPYSPRDRATWEHRGTIGKPLAGEGTPTQAQYDQVAEFIENVGPRFPQTFGVKSGEYSTSALDILMDNGRATEDRIIPVTRYLGDPVAEDQIQQVRDIDISTLTSTDLFDPNMVTAIREFDPERFPELLTAQRQDLVNRGIWARGGGPEVGNTELDEGGFPAIRPGAATANPLSSLQSTPKAFGVLGTMLAPKLGALEGPKQTMFMNAAVTHLRDAMAEGGQSLFDNGTREERQAKMLKVMDDMAMTYLTDTETEHLRQAYVTWPAELSGYLIPGVGAAKAPRAFVNVLKAIPRLKQMSAAQKVIKAADRFDAITDATKTTSQLLRVGKRVTHIIPSAVSDAMLGWISTEDYPAIGREVPAMNTWLKAHGIDPESSAYSAAEAGILSGAIQSLFAAVKPFIGAVNDTSARGAMRKNKALRDAANAIGEAAPQLTDAERAKAARVFTHRKTSGQLGELAERFKAGAQAAAAEAKAVTGGVEQPGRIVGKGNDIPAREFLDENQRRILNEREALQAERAASKSKSRAGGAGPSATQPPQPVPPVRPAKPKPPPDLEVRDGQTAADRYRGLGKGHNHLDLQLASLEMRKEITPLSRVFLRELMRDIDDDFLRAFTIDINARDEMGVIFSGFARHGNANDLTRGTITDRQAIFDAKGTPLGNVGIATNPRFPGMDTPIMRGPAVVMTPSARGTFAPAARAGGELAQLNARDLSFTTWHEVGHIAQNFLTTAEERAAFSQFAQETFADDTKWKKVSNFIQGAHRAGRKGPSSTVRDAGRINAIRGQERELFAELFALNTVGDALVDPSLGALFRSSVRKLKNSVRAILGKPEAQDILNSPLKVGDTETTVARMFEDVLMPRKPGFFEDLEKLYGPQLGKQKAKLLRTELRKFPINDDTFHYFNNRWVAKGKNNLEIEVSGADPASAELHVMDGDLDVEIRVQQDGTVEFSDLQTQNDLTRAEVNTRLDSLGKLEEPRVEAPTFAPPANAKPKRPVPPEQKSTATGELAFKAPGAPPFRATGGIGAKSKTGKGPGTGPGKLAFQAKPVESTTKPPVPKPEPTPTPTPVTAATAFSAPARAKPKGPVPKAQQVGAGEGTLAFRAPPKKLKGKRPVTPVDSSPSVQRVEIVGDGITLQAGETVRLKDGTEAVVAYIPSRQPLVAKGRQADIGPIYIHGKFGPERVSSDKIDEVLGYSTKPKAKTLGDPNMEYATEGVTLKQWTVGNRSTIRLDPWQVTLLNQLEAGYQARLVVAEKAFEGNKNTLRRGKKIVRSYPQEGFNALKLFEMNELHERMLADVIGQPNVMHSPEYFSRRVIDALRTTSGTITTNARAKLFVNMLNNTLEQFPPVQAKRIYRKLFDDIFEARPRGMDMPGNSELYLKRAILAVKGEKGKLARETLSESQLLGDYFDEAADEFGYAGIQEGVPDRGVPDIELWHVLTKEYEALGLTEGSTVSRQTIEKMGIEMPSNPPGPDAAPLHHTGLDAMAESLADDIGDPFVDNASSYLATILIRDGYRGTVARALTPVAHLGMDEQVNRALIEVLSKDLGIPVNGIPHQQQILERAQSTLNRWLGEGKIPIGEIPSSFTRPVDMNVALNVSHDASTTISDAAKREDARRAMSGNPRDPVNLEPVPRPSLKNGDLIHIGGEPWVVIDNTQQRIAISHARLGKVFVTPDDLEGGFVHVDSATPVQPMRIDLPDMDIDISRLTDPHVAIQGLNPAEKMITLAAKYAMVYGARAGGLFKKAMAATKQSKAGEEVWSFISGVGNTPRAAFKHQSIKGYVTAKGADWFLSAGYLPRDIHLQNVKRSQQIKYEEWWARRLVQRYVKRTDEYLRETGADELSQELIDNFNAYLKGPSLATIRGVPQKFRSVLSNMRRHQTRISRALISTGAIDPNSPIAMIVGKNDATYLHRSYALFEDDSFRQRMQTKLEATNGNDAIFRNVRGWVTDQLKASGLNPDDYAEEIAAYPGQILHMREGEYIAGNSGFGKTMAAAGPGGAKKIRLSPEIFFHKGDVAEPIRRLMGEYGLERGVEVAYLNSVMKSAKWMHNHYFLTQMREMGLAKGMFRTITPDSPKNLKARAAGVGHIGEAFVDPVTGKEWTHRVIEPGEFGYSQLDDVVTTKEISKQLRRMLGISQRGGDTNPWKWSLDTMIMGNAWAKLNATVFNAMTHVRNFLGNTEFMVSNGYAFDFIRHPGVAAGNARDTAQMVARNVAGEGSWVSAKAMQLGKMSDEQWERRMEELIRRGIVGEGTFTGEVRALYKDFASGGVWESNGSLYEKFLDVFERAGEKSRKLARTNKAHSLVHRVGSKGAKVFEAYQAGDDFWRIMAYELETNKLSNALLGTANGKGGTWTAETIRTEAAQRIRNTMPTYSEVPRFIQNMRLNPLIAPFVSFWWESFRTRFHGIKYAFQDMASDNPAMQKLGARRMMGLLTVPAAYLGLETASFSIDEVLTDGSKNESVRYSAPPWNRNGNIIGANNKMMDKIFGPRPSNVVRFADMSYLFPIEYMMDPLRTMVRGTPDGEIKMFADVFGFLEPMLGGELFAQKLGEVFTNENNQFRGEGRPAIDSVKASLAHFFSPMVPGTIKSLNRVAQGFVDDTKEDAQYALRRNPWVELAAMTTGIRIVEQNLDSSHFFKWRKANATMKDGKGQFNRNAIFKRSTIDEDEVVKWYEKMVRAEHLGWSRAHVAFQNFTNLEQPLSAARREMRRAGLPDHVASAITSQAPQFKAPTISNKDFKDMRANGQKLNETEIRQRALAIANEYEDLPVDLVAEQIRARHPSARTGAQLRP